MALATVACLNGLSASAQDEPPPTHPAAINAFDKDTGNLRWRTKVGGKSGILNVVYADNGVVLARQTECSRLPRESKLIAFDATTGRELWQRDSQESSNAVYFPGVGSPTPPVDPGLLERIGVKSGQSKWRIAFDGYEGVIGGNDQTVLLMKLEPKLGLFVQLRGVDLKTGKILWAFPNSSERIVIAGTAIGEDSVVVGTEARESWETPVWNVRALDTATGRERWRATNSPLAGGWPVVGSTVVTWSEPDRELRPVNPFDTRPLTKVGVTGYDLHTGREVWNVPIEANGVVRGGDDVILAQSFVGIVQHWTAIDANTGGVLWSAPIGEPTAADQGLIVAYARSGSVSPENSLTVIDAHTGAVRWARDYVPWIYGNFVIGRYVYAGEGCGADQGS